MGSHLHTISIFLNQLHTKHTSNNSTSNQSSCLTQRKHIPPSSQLESAAFPLSLPGFGEQAQEKLTPQSQKSTGQVIGENLTGAGDKVAAAVQPSSEKSTTQKAGDSVRGSGDSAQKEGGGMLNSVSKTVTDTVNSITGQTKDTAKKNDL